MPTDLDAVSARKRKAQALPPTEITVLLVCIIIFLCMLVLLLFDQSNRTVGATLREQSRNPPRRILPDIDRTMPLGLFTHPGARQSSFLLLTATVTVSRPPLAVS